VPLSSLPTLRKLVVSVVPLGWPRAMYRGRRRGANPGRESIPIVSPASHRPAAVTSSIAAVGRSVLQLQRYHRRQNGAILQLTSGTGAHAPILADRCK